MRRGNQSERGSPPRPRQCRSSRPSVRATPAGIITHAGESPATSNQKIFQITCRFLLLVRATRVMNGHDRRAVQRTSEMKAFTIDNETTSLCTHRRRKLPTPTAAQCSYRRSNWLPRKQSPGRDLEHPAGRCPGQEVQGPADGGSAGVETEAIKATPKLRPVFRKPSDRRRTRGLSDRNH